jgi:hypothetical protein
VLLSCDCRTVEFRQDRASYEVLIDRRWKMSNPFWLRVPPNRIIDRTDNPTNRGVVCFTPEASILCFVRPAESVLALESSVDRLVRLGETSLALSATATGLCEQPGLAGDMIGRRPGQPRCLELVYHQPHLQGFSPTRRAISRLGIPADFNFITSRTWRIASLSDSYQVDLMSTDIE